jgi:glycosyltransferase involved in cell wall biosynthesis
LTQGFLKNDHIVSVIDDPTMPGVSNFGNTHEEIKQFITNIDILYVRIDARYIHKWKVLSDCMDLIDSQPVVWEINSPANETLAFSWLSGRSINKKEGMLRRLKRWLHASLKKPGIFREERYRRRMAKGVNSAICVSKVLARYASECLGINDTLILPNGGPIIPENEIFLRRKRRKQKKFTVLYSGSAMYPWQGLDYLSSVIAIAEREDPDITFILAVNQRSPMLPSSENVIILEGLNREEMLDEICGADVCVALHPEYFWSKYGFHGSPMKLFEYMACMTPSVTSNIGQMRDIIRDGVDGILCENEPREILKKLQFLKKNQEQAANIGRKGWERIQAEFSWENNVKQTLKCFELAL